MRAGRWLLAALGSIGFCAAPALASDLATLYSARAVVTGTGAENRVLGARDCLRQVIVRVSGDQRLLGHAALPALLDDAVGLLAAFRYRDRLEGIPIHDEQGTYDRPHDLFCSYDPARIDPVLGKLGATPWLAERPRLMLFLHVKNARQEFWLASDGNDSPYMRDSLALGAAPLALAIDLPDQATFARLGLGSGLPDPASLAPAASQSGGDLPLAGSLEWSDAELGWIARFGLVHEGRSHEWGARGISFDEAFRIAARGATQILSDNGAP